MKKPLVRFLVVLVIAFIVTSASVAIIDYVSAHKPATHAPSYSNVSLCFIDLADPQYGSEHLISNTQSTGMQTFSSTRKYVYESEYVGRSRHGDVYVFAFTIPSGSNVLKTVVFNGDKYVLFDNEAERIEIIMGQHPHAP